MNIVSSRYSNILLNAEELHVIYQFPACGARPDPANGQITILQGDGAADGSVIKFECDTGHTVSGTNIINCAGGAWSGPDPTCQIDGKF